MALLNMIFLFPRWDMLVPWRVIIHLLVARHLPGASLSVGFIPGVFTWYVGSKSNELPPSGVSLKIFEQSDNWSTQPPTPNLTTHNKNIQQIQTAHRMAPEWTIKSVVFHWDIFSISSPFGQAQVETRRPLYNHLVNCLRYVFFSGVFYMFIY